MCVARFIIILRTKNRSHVPFENVIMVIDESEQLHPRGPGATTIIPHNPIFKLLRRVALAALLETKPCDGRQLPNAMARLPATDAADFVVFDEPGGQEDARRITFLPGHMKRMLQCESFADFAKRNVRPLVNVAHRIVDQDPSMPDRLFGASINPDQRVRAVQYDLSWETLITPTNKRVRLVRYVAGDNKTHQTCVVLAVADVPPLPPPLQIDQHLRHRPATFYQQPSYQQPCHHYARGH